MWQNSHTPWHVLAKIMLSCSGGYTCSGVFRRELGAVSPYSSKLSSHSCRVLVAFCRRLGVVGHCCFEHRIGELEVVARGADEALLRTLSVVITGDRVRSPDSLLQFVAVVNFLFRIFLLIFWIAPRIADLDRIVRILVQINTHRIVLAVDQRHPFGFLAVDDRGPAIEQRHIRIAYPLAEHPLDGMIAAAKIALEVLLFLRRRSLVGDLVSLVAVVNQNNVRLVLDLDVAYFSKEQEDVLSVDDFETILVGIFEVVSVRNSI